MLLYTLFWRINEFAFKGLSPGHLKGPDHKIHIFPITGENYEIFYTAVSFLVSLYLDITADISSQSKLLPDDLTNTSLLAG